MTGQAEKRTLGGQKDRINEKIVVLLYFVVLNIPNETLSEESTYEAQYVTT
jgi:hypothetical protein